jgi:hypothetical protein
VIPKALPVPLLPCKNRFFVTPEIELWSSLTESTRP